MKFILNDETKINSKGFRVLNSGISLSRFLDNPVCLNNHSNNTKDVLGTWGNVSIDGNFLTASPEFDTEDPDGKEVVRKVNAGKIKACSIGIFIEPNGMELINDELVVTKCELFEASIVAVPSNANAIALYNEKGEILSDKEVTSLCLSAKNNHSKLNTMKQVIAYLQLDANADETAIIGAVKAIEAKLTASENEKATLKAENEALKKAEDDRKKAILTAEVEQAVKDGRLDEAGKAPILALAHDSAMALLKALPKRKSVSEQLKGDEEKLAEFDKMTWDELDKGNHLATLKAQYPDYFEERKRKQFPKN
ncbi:HK97 family phage prohead protease [Riemerella anatipestifer]|uniref:HK97 family phage prohead protease n=1 Tax=Riemerella anatipestifer TaxID=34085 RepID=UPI0007EDF007|nr:HK97 family phage prohead protease [Riemerella anatipestifer]MBT0527121.1 HK97 family phage prohead protease [Riemerella anatipestifer]WFS34615.1 HK97 family phage prohead protease [Riemerella anatipestifer]